MQKKRRGKIKMKSLYKLWWVIIVTMLVPFLVAFLVVYQGSIRTLTDQNHQHNIYILQKSVQLHDNFVSQNQKLLQQLSKDETLVKLTYNTDLEQVLDGVAGNQLPAMNVLYEYAITNQYVSSVYFYNSKQQIVLLSTGEAYDAEVFYDREWMDYLQQFPLGVKYIDSVRKVEHPRLGSKRYFTLLCRVPYTTWDQTGAIVVNYSADELYQKLINHAQYQEGDILVFNRYGEVLFGGPKADGLAEDLPVVSNEGRWVGDYGGEEHLMTYVTSPYTGCKFIYAVPMTVVKGKTQKIAYMAAWAASLAVLILIIGAFLISFHVYNPLDQLVRMVGRKEEGKRDNGGFLGEYSILKEAYDRQEEENRQIKRETEDLRRYAREEIAKRLITGVCCTDKEEQQLHWALLQNSPGAYLVGIAERDAEKAQKTTALLEVRRRLYLHFEPSCESVWCVMDTRLLVGIVENTYGDMPQSICRKMEQEQPLQYRVLGPFREKEGLRRGYRELVKNLLLGQVSEPEEKNEACCLEHEQCQSWIRYIKGRKKEQLERSVEEYFLWASSLEDWKPMTKELASFLSELEEVMEPFGWQDNPLLRKTQQKLLQEDSLEAVKHLTGQALQACEEQVEAYVNGRNERKVEQIQEYIDSHLSEDFSLQDVAETVGISVSYCGKLFKEAAGVNIMEYCAMERVKRAKKLLWDTELSVGEIAEKIGFNSAQTFLRAFKKQEGITPGQYRGLKGR